LRPCRWVGLPRRIPFVGRTPAAVPGPRWTGVVRPTTTARACGARRLLSAVLSAGRTGRLSTLGQAPAIARLGRFGAQLSTAMPTPPINQSTSIDASACHGDHRPPGPRAGQTARPGSPRRAAP
jgi:hypothetical protein